MGGLSSFAIFIAINAFFIGVLFAIGLRHAYAHVRPHPEEKRINAATPDIKISPELKEALQKQAEEEFKQTVNRASQLLYSRLDASTSSLSQSLNSLGSALLEDEMDRFKTDIMTLRDRTEATIKETEKTILEHESQIAKSIDEQQKALEASVQANVAAATEKQLAQMDAKLSDAVVAFLEESLQHEVDLGTQSDYIMRQLEAHKDELKREVAS